MLRKPYLRATIFVLGLGFFIQITGINATVTYGPKIFGAMGIESDQQKLLLNVGIQFIALIAVLVSMRTVDRWGRRPILLTGIGIMIFAQLLMVITFATVENDQYAGWQKALGFAGIALINIGFVFGFGALVWVYSSEAFPARLRAYGSSAMLTADLVANWIIANFFLSAMEKVGGAVSFGFFALMAVLAWLFVFKLAPETKGRELEEIRHYWENGGSWDAPKSKVEG
jgi:MFS family permease